MVVFDIVCDGEIRETFRPSNQNRRELYWFIVDRLPLLRQKYGHSFTVYRRSIQE
ncbi:hypothetical protein [Paenibacillus sp. GYB003]|uniref:hypothetical protein n=1 Tax=Paenibacillus sp. GYB003 TaxID=2994392 RepID=UPI002F9644EB